MTETDKNVDLSLDDITSLEEQLSSLNENLQELRGKETISEVIQKEQETQDEIKKQEELLKVPDLYIFGRLKEKRKLDVFQQLDSILEVNKGQLLASIPEEANKETVDIVGGENVIVTPDRKKFYASVSGQLYWNKNVVSVIPIKKFDGDVDSTLGEVYYKGNVSIKGNVLDGVKIRATGDIFITENVNKAEIISEKNIFVKNGYKGRDGGLLKAKGNVIVRFVENGNIESDENVIVGESIMHSTISARRQVALIGEKKIIVGGKIIAGEEINCAILGSENYTTTEVQVGATTTEREQLETDRAQLNAFEKEYQEVDLNIGTLIAQKESGRISTDHEKKLLELKSRRAYLKDEIARLKKRTRQVEENIQMRKSGRVCASEIVYPGIRYTITRAVGQINKEIRHVSLIDEKGKMTQAPYEETKLKFIPIFATELDESDIVKIKENENIVSDLSQFRRNIIIMAKSERAGFEKGCELLGLAKDDVVHTILKHPTPQNDKMFELHIVEVKPGENKNVIKRKIIPKERLNIVQVEGETIEECLQKASAYLKTPVDKLTYRVLQKARAGIAGLGKKSYILKVSIKEEKSRVPKEILKEIGKNIDGYFTIQNTLNGLILTVSPPKGDGAPVDESAILKDLNLYKYEKDINFGLISETVANSTGKPVVIGPRQPEPELDGKFEIGISDDNLKCTVTVYPAKEGGVPVTYEDVLNALHEKAISNINEEKLKSIFENNLFGEEVVVAEGVPAIQGEDARIEYKIKVAEDSVKHFSEDEKGRVDFREINLIENVVKGQVLAVKIPATEGKSGIDIFGNEIPATDGKDIILQAGKNTVVSDDGMELKSEIDGHAALMGNKIKVDPIYYVNGDISYETGNINFLGTVVIKGSVRDDFVVRATGDVHVVSIGKAEVESEGSIYIKSGIMGRDQAIVKAGMDLYAKFIEQANVEVGRYLVVEDAIMHSKISAGKSILVLEGKRCLIVGGTIRAGEDIYAKELGANLATKTLLEVGIDPAVRQRIFMLETELDEQRKNFDKVSKGIKALSKLKKDTGSLPEAKESLLLELVGVARVLGSKLKNIEEELKTLHNKMQESKKGKICIQNIIYTGVRITIRNATLIISNELKFASFYYENGEVKIGNYEEPPKKLLDEIHGRSAKEK